MSDEAHEATPDHELERQIMSYNEAKNEREWWAMHEIERLREALLEIQKRAEQQSTMPFDRHADYFRMARAALGEDEK